MGKMKKKKDKQGFSTFAKNVVFRLIPMALAYIDPRTALAYVYGELKQFWGVG